jgi:hypothetical protein
MRWLLPVERALPVKVLPKQFNGGRSVTWPAALIRARPKMAAVTIQLLSFAKIWAQMAS